MVVFSNSVLFGTTPLYKQLPGTSYAWHELALTLAADTDPSAQLVLTNAANSVYNRYRKVIERQHALLERLLDADVPSHSQEPSSSSPTQGWSWCCGIRWRLARRRKLMMR